MRFPKSNGQHQFRAYKVSKRFDQDISAVCGTFNLELDGNTAKSIRICFGGMVATTRRALMCEQSLLNEDWTEENIKRAMEAMTLDFQPITDKRGSKEYRMRVAQNLLYNAFLETSESVSQTRVLEAVETP